MQELTVEQMRDFLPLAERLSPENLFRDGTASRQEAIRAKAEVMRQWRRLESRHGIKVSEADVWAARMEERGWQAGISVRRCDS